MADKMTNVNWRDALQGVERQALDLLSEVITSEQWVQLLKDPLDRAVAQGKRGLVRKLLQAGAEIGTAIHAAVRGGHEEIVDDLLEDGASMNEEDTSGDAPLHLAVRLPEKAGTAMVQLLLLKRANPDVLDRMKCTPLHYAVWFDGLPAALALLSAGADVNIRCGWYYQYSAIETAASYDRVEIARALIKHGANVNSHNSRSRDFTPLHRAASHNAAGVIDVLIEAGANTGARNEHGATPLHVACSTDSEAAAALLKGGAGVNALDDAGRTPLWYAAAEAGEGKSADMVDLLLRSGADENIVDEDGTAAANVVGLWFEDRHDEDDDIVYEDAGLVRRLLANAPADRAWRRRGYLALCRAYPDRMQQGQDSSSCGHAGATRGNQKGARLSTAEGGRGDRAVGDCAADEGTMDWASVMARVLGLQEEEGIFRTIVGCLSVTLPVVRNP